ncbi:MAG: hypothetical protein ABEJ30_00695 [Halorientalis sp.]
MSRGPTTMDRDETGAPEIRSHRATEERTVFTEEGNTDGWIATDLTVDLAP